MPEFLIWSEGHRAWWRSNGHGYTSSIREAGRYRQDDAQRIVEGANYGGTFNEIAIPVPEGIPSA